MNKTSSSPLKKKLKISNSQKQLKTKTIEDDLQSHKSIYEITKQELLNSSDIQDHIDVKQNRNLNYQNFLTQTSTNPDSDINHASITGWNFNNKQLQNINMNNNIQIQKMNIKHDIQQKSKLEITNSQKNSGKTYYLNNQYNLNNNPLSVLQTFANTNNTYTNDIRYNSEKNLLTDQEEYDTLLKDQGNNSLYKPMKHNYSTSTSFFKTPYKLNKIQPLFVKSQDTLEQQKSSTLADKLLNVQEFKNRSKIKELIQTYNQEKEMLSEVYLCKDDHQVCIIQQQKTLKNLRQAPTHKKTASLYEQYSLTPEKQIKKQTIFKKIQNQQKWLQIQQQLRQEQDTPENNESKEKPQIQVLHSDQQQVQNIQNKKAVATQKNRAFQTGLHFFPRIRSQYSFNNNQINNFNYQSKISTRQPEQNKQVHFQPIVSKINKVQSFRNYWN